MAPAPYFSFEHTIWQSGAFFFFATVSLCVVSIRSVQESIVAVELSNHVFVHLFALIGIDSSFRVLSSSVGIDWPALRCRCSRAKPKTGANAGTRRASRDQARIHPINSHLISFGLAHRQPPLFPRTRNCQVTARKKEDDEMCWGQSGSRQSMGASDWLPVSPVSRTYPAPSYAASTLLHVLPLVHVHL